MTTPRTIAVLTTGRQDWGILRSTCEAITAHPDLVLALVVAGTHLSERHGRTIDEIRADGFEPALEVPSVTPVTESQPAIQASAVVAGLSPILEGDTRADALLLVGDRFETAAAALAATIARLPIAHIHGGEQTIGAIDDALRHAITKLSHLHLVSHEEHAARVVAMGEDPATVHVVGAPGLDAAYRRDVPDRAELEDWLGIRLVPPVVVVTVHPGTLETEPSAAATSVSTAMDAVDATYVVTLPNVDPGHVAVRSRMEAAGGGPRRVAVEALGSRRYWGVLRIADALLGNSSSAIVEAPALGLPAVDVGDRQSGRRRESNVIHAPAEPGAVTEALRAALAMGRGEAPTSSRLGDGRAGVRVADILAAWRPPDPPRKAPVPIRR